MAEEQREITVTYETLFEILKREKDLADLQKLDESFFSDFVKYFQEKQEILDKEDSSVFSFDERKKAEKQIENARRIIKDIYDRREKKIMNFALIKSRTKTDIMDMSTFLASEKKMFDEAVKVLSAFRDTVANNLIVGRQPIIPDLSVSGGGAPVNGSSTQPFVNSEKNIPVSSDVSAEVSSEVASSDSEVSTEEKKPSEGSNSMKLVRFLYAVPKFVGTELEEYGPFEEEDIANLPGAIADLLLEKGKVEEIQG